MTCGAFQASLNLINDGEDVDAAVANRPLQQLIANDNYLNCLLQAINQGGGNGSSCLILRGVQLKSTVQVGMPVFYNTGTSLFEPTLDDGSATRNVLGLCIDKIAGNIGDLLIAGTLALDLTIPIGGSPVAGRYFLSTTVSGGLTTDVGGVQACFLDNNGNVTFAPDIQNALTSIGSTSTTNSPVTLVSWNNASGLNGVGAVKNTGTTHPLLLVVSATDAFGTSATANITVAPGSAQLLSTLTGIALSFWTQPNASIIPPYVSYSVTVQALVSGQQTTYTGKFMTNQG